MLWTLTAFFGATVAFGLIRNATEGESVWLSLGLQLVALAAIVALVVAVVRRQGR